MAKNIYELVAGLQAHCDKRCAFSDCETGRSQGCTWQLAPDETQEKIPGAAFVEWRGGKVFVLDEDERLLGSYIVSPDGEFCRA